MAEDGNDHGINEVGATMHWGPDGDNNKYYLTRGERYDADNEIRLHFRVSDMRKTLLLNLPLNLNHQTLVNMVTYTCVRVQRSWKTS